MTGHAFAFNNAGTATLAPSTTTSVVQQKAMVDLNVTALMLLSNAVLPQVIAKNEGTLINASVLGFFSLPFSSVYSGTKGFVIQYTRGGCKSSLKKRTNVTC
jgi:short-subunit dehydrogenase